MNKYKNIFSIPLAVALLAICLAGYFYYQLSILKQNPQAVAQKETEELVARVSKLVILPEGETPTVATVSDPEALKNQAFFASAQKGDKVLIYTQAKKAILYSTTMNKILEIAPLNLGEQNPTVNQSATTPKPKTTATTSSSKTSTTTKTTTNSEEN